MFYKSKSNIKQYVANLNSDSVAKTQLTLVSRLKEELKELKMDRRLFATCMRQLQARDRKLSKCIAKQIYAYDELQSLDRSLQLVDRNEPTASVKEFLEFLGISYDVDAEAELWQEHQLWCDALKTAVAGNLKTIQEEVCVVKQRHEQVMALFDSTETDIKGAGDRILPYLLRTRISQRCDAIGKTLSKKEALVNSTMTYLYCIVPVMWMLQSYGVALKSAFVVALVWPYALLLGLFCNLGIALELSFFTLFSCMGFGLVLGLGAVLLFVLCIAASAIAKVISGPAIETCRTLATSEAKQQLRVAQILAEQVSREE